MEIKFLGALNYVGASALLVKSNDISLMLDYGAKPREIPPGKPLDFNGNVDALLLTHAHLDHSGYVPLLVKEKNCNVFGTDITLPLSEILLKDSLKISREENFNLNFNENDIENFREKYVSINYNQNYFFNDVKVNFLDASHIPGSASILIESENKKLLYTGDFNTIETNLIKRNFIKIDELNYLITESTYWNREHENRKKEEKKLVKIVEETVKNDGICLIPSFAISRAQEVLLILHNYGIDYEIYMDGMCKKTTTIINKFKKYLKDPNALNEALKNVKYVSKKSERKKVIKRNCVVIAGSGFLEGGPIYWYLRKLMFDKKSSIVFVGYQVEGTNGRILLETNKFENKEVKIRVEKVDLSAHAGRKEILEFIKENNPEKIFCVHGENLENFSEELEGLGYHAIAPTIKNNYFKL